MQKSRDAMSSIDYLEFSVSDENYDGFGNGVIGSDEVCTCPKPLLTPFQICEYCRKTFNASIDHGLDHPATRLTKRYGLYVESKQIPSCEMPKGKGETT